MRKPLRENTFRFAWGALRRDAQRAGERFACTAGFWLVAGYRVKRLRKTNGLAAVVLFPLDLLLTVARPISAPGCQIPWQTRIGPGLTVQHAWGVVVGGRCRLGSRVTLFQGVTVGRWRGGFPKIRSDSAVFPGAKVFGDVTIGRRCMVAANAVVNRDVPSHHVAAGVPARVWRRKDLGRPGDVGPEPETVQTEMKPGALVTGREA